MMVEQKQSTESSGSIDADSMQSMIDNLYTMSKRLMEETTKVLVERGEDVMPFMVVPEPGSDRLTLVGIAGTDTAEQRAAAMREVIKQTKALAFVFICDAWTRDPQTMQRNGEVLNLILSTHNGMGNKVYALPYTRGARPADDQPEPIIWKEPIEADGQMIHNVWPVATH